MRDLQKIEFAVNLALLDDPDLTDDEIIKSCLDEFGISLNKEDLNVLYASYLPDNFEAESKLMEYYGTFGEY